jgi:hypothetical protein
MYSGIFGSLEMTEELFSRPLQVAVIIVFSPYRKDLKKNVVAPQKGDEKFPLETREMERGVKGMLPLCCLPAGGKR